MKEKRFKRTVDLLLLTIFLYLGFKVRNSSEGILFDVFLLEFIHNNTYDILLNFMKFISFIGSGWFLFPAIGVAVIYFYIKKNQYICKILIMNTLGSWVFNFILKQVFHRTRPLDYFLVEQGGLSYPSGHSMVTMSMYLAISYLLRRTMDKSKEKKIYLYASLFILLMGVSRMYLGVHWPTDIIGGYIMGYLFFNITIKLIK